MKWRSEFQKSYLLIPGGCGNCRGGGDGVCLEFELYKKKVINSGDYQMQQN